MESFLLRGKILNIVIKYVSSTYIFDVSIAFDYAEYRIDTR